MRCEMPSEMREEMLSGVRGWVTADNAIDAEGRMNGNSMNEADGKAAQVIESFQAVYGVWVFRCLWVQ